MQPRHKDHYNLPFESVFDFLASYTLGKAVCSCEIFLRMYIGSNGHRKTKNRSLRRCCYIFSIFALATYIAVYSSLSSRHFKHSLLVETGVHTPPVKIVLWTGSLRNAGIKGFKNARLERMQQIVRKMNTEENEICKIIRMDGRDGREINSVDDEDNDELGHCEFSMSSPSDTLSDGDAIAFFMFNDGYKLSELPNLDSRKAEQIWIMYSREPPPMSHWKNPLGNLFNWTMSYRRDSDIWTPYGKYVERFHPIQTEDFLFSGDAYMTQWIAGKSKLITGVITNCHTHSLREKLINQMKSTGVQVDVNGACGQPTTCGRYSNSCGDFWRDLARKYKFYMAFENSLCEDYITEKFWRGLDMGMVPVVYGGGNYELEAPPNSYIDVRDFSSAEDLMKYLKYLDDNPEEYAKYFEWKRKFKLQKYWDTFLEDWCSLCRAVKKYRKDGLLIPKTYENLNFWWKHKPDSNESVCLDKPKKYFMMKNKLFL